MIISCLSKGDDAGPAECYSVLWFLVALGPHKSTPLWLSVSKPLSSQSAGLYARRREVMSGIEAAGFVLAVFPLLITALEHYRASAEVLSDWWQIKREYRKCRDEIRFHQLAFEQNLEKYLLPLIVDEDELQDLIADPGGPRWRDPELEERLKERLPKAYDLYFSTILQMNETMKDLENELGGKKLHPETTSNEKESLSRRDDGMPEKKSKGRRRKLLTRPGLEFEAQRIKFSFGKHERSKLFQEISGYNTRLKELLDTSDHISAMRGTRSAKRGLKASKGLMQVWRHASSIFKLLAKAFTCQCSSLHNVNLRLEHRTAPEVSFNLLFLFDGSHPRSPNSPWNGLETQVSLLETDNMHITRSFSEFSISKPGRPGLRQVSRTMSSLAGSTLV